MGTKRRVQSRETAAAPTPAETKLALAPIRVHLARCPLHDATHMRGLIPPLIHLSLSLQRFRGSKRRGAITRIHRYAGTGARGRAIPVDEAGVPDDEAPGGAGDLGSGLASSLAGSQGQGLGVEEVRR